MTESTNPALFIVFEGGDGCGKTTMVQYLASLMHGEPGIKYMLTREPGGTPIAEEIRNMIFKLKASDNETLFPMTELLLFNAARCQHVLKMRQYLDNGVHVICDRFTDSTYAYQCKVGRLSDDTFDTMAELVQGQFEPDVVILLDADPDLIKDRMRGRTDNNAFDDLDMRIKREIRDGLLTRAFRSQAKTGTIYYLVDATQDMESVMICISKIYQHLRDNNFSTSNIPKQDKPYAVTPSGVYAV